MLIWINKTETILFSVYSLYSWVELIHSHIALSHSFLKARKGKNWRKKKECLCNPVRVRRRGEKCIKLELMQKTVGEGGKKSSSASEKSNVTPLFSRNEKRHAPPPILYLYYVFSLISSSTTTFLTFFLALNQSLAAGLCWWDSETCMWWVPSQTIGGSCSHKSYSNTWRYISIHVSLSYNPSFIAFIHWIWGCLCSDPAPPVDEFVKHGILPRFLELLSREDAPYLQVYLCMHCIFQFSC